MAFGSTTLQRGDSGPDVAELQLRLAGFRGTLWDGNFGPGTELQLIAFQRDFMGMANPTGVADTAVFGALKQLAERYPLDFGKLACPCGQCGGFGNGKFKDEYRNGARGVEQANKYEYPGIHKAILHTFRAASFYCEQAGLGLAHLTSGYRCWVDNNKHKRTSTNHMGKALDLDFPRRPGETDKHDRNRCDLARGILVEKCGFQIGWSAANQKALEPSSIAPTWVHMDVRQYRADLLDEAFYFYVTSADQLDAFDLPAADPAVPSEPIAPPPTLPLDNLAAVLNSMNTP